MDKTKTIVLAAILLAIIIAIAIFAGNCVCEKQNIVIEQNKTIELPNKLYGYSIGNTTYICTEQICSKDCIQIEMTN